MKHYTVIISLIVLLSVTTCVAQNNEIGVSHDLLRLEQPVAQLFYKRSLNDNWRLRAFLGFNMDTDKEVRADTVFLDQGEISYYVSAGIERALHLDKNSAWSLYAGADFYLHSSFIKPSKESYYGYYYHYGLKPVYGLRFDPVKKLALGVECRSLFDLDLQSYTAEGTNNDTRLFFKGLDAIVVSAAYRF